MKKRIIVKETEWERDPKYKTGQWENSVVITRWEHDYVKKHYVIDYNG